MKLKRILYSTSKENTILGSGFFGGISTGGFLGRKYRLKKEQKDAEKSFDPKKEADLCESESEKTKRELKKVRQERERLESGKDKEYGDDIRSRLRDLDIEEEELEGYIVSCKKKAADIKSNPEKYRKEAGLKAKQNLKNKIHNGTVDRFSKYEKRGAIIGGTVGSALGFAGALKINKKL